MRTTRESAFHISTTFISISLALAGLAGVYLTPENAGLILLGLGAVLLIVILNDKTTEIAEISQQVEELTKRLNTERRFAGVERELAEQRIRLSVQR